MISFWKLVITYISRLSGRKTISFISLFKILIIYIHIQIWFYPLPDTPSLLKVTAWQIARSIKTSSQNTQTFHTGKDRFFPTLKKEYMPKYLLSFLLVFINSFFRSGAGDHHEVEVHHAGEVRNKWDDTLDVK